jgi:hypothetical protein
MYEKQAIWYSKIMMNGNIDSISFYDSW